MATGLVRTLKAWKRHAGVDVKSFHLEVMTLQRGERQQSGK